MALLAICLPYSDAVRSILILHTCINPLYYTLFCLICTVKHSVPMVMARLHSESLVCVLDAFLTLPGSLPRVGLTYMVDFMSELQMFTALWNGSNSDPKLCGVSENAILKATECNLCSRMKKEVMFLCVF